MSSLYVNSMQDKTYHTIGLMSGSSLDGLDIAYVIFNFQQNKWSFELQAYECIEYPPTLLHKLKTAKQLGVEEFYKIHTQLGHYFGNAVKNFCSLQKIKHIDLVSSHGHTIFHDPENMVTCQIGCGAAIAASCGFLTVADLRSMDIAYRGQGAPIVPIGDRLLFDEYDAWLNIGGIANITIKNNDQYIAFDIAAANQILNHYSNILGKLYDENGWIAAKNKVYEPLLNQLNEHPFYQLAAPKSLDNSFSKNIISLIDSAAISTEDKIATYTEHLAYQIAITTKKNSVLLATGGGANNSHLMNRIQSFTTCKICIPEKAIINYKEAIVMAFIGVLRIENKANILSSVTGAIKNSISGAVYIP